MGRTRTRPRPIWAPPDLKGRVVVVTGASRGLGRAIAATLGECGATVYVTGRTETVAETAEQVTARGGRGVAVRCDHSKAPEVRALFERVQKDAQRLDVLVNNAWGGYEGAGVEVKRFWKADFERAWAGMFEGGLRAQMVTTQIAAPLLIAAKGGLVVSTVAWDQGKYLGSVAYDVAKASVVRFIEVMSHELRAHRVAMVGVAPGFMRTERVLAHFNVAAEDWRTIPALKGTESPEYAARGVVKLAADPRVLRFSGEVHKAAQLARRYRFTDVDGRQVRAFELPPLRTILRSAAG